MLDNQATQKEIEVYEIATKTYYGKRPIDCIYFSFCGDITETCNKTDNYEPCYLFCNCDCNNFKSGKEQQ